MKIIIKIAMSLLFCTQAAFPTEISGKSALELLNLRINYSSEELEKSYEEKKAEESKKVKKSKNENQSFVGFFTHLTDYVKKISKKYNITTAYKKLKNIKEIGDKIAQDPCACYDYSTDELIELFSFFKGHRIIKDDPQLINKLIEQLKLDPNNLSNVIIDSQHSFLLSGLQENPTCYFFPQNVSDTQKTNESINRIERIKINIAYELLQRKFNPASLRKSQVRNDIKFNEEPLLKKHRTENDYNISKELNSMTSKQLISMTNQLNSRKRSRD